MPCVVRTRKKGGGGEGREEKRGGEGKREGEKREGRDGRHTLTATGTDAKGQNIHNVSVYTKQ